MRIEVVTLFPQLIEAGLSAGVLGRAVAKGRVHVGLENPRSHAEDAHRTVDDRPFGGGPGMVLKAEPLARAVRAAKARLPAGAPVIGLSAQGAPFDQGTARRLAGLGGFALVAGRYEGIDQRATDALVDEELSIGDEASAGQDSFGDGLLDWPHYTRPELWEGRPVPEVLLGGNHAAIRRWRLAQALGRTWQRRPDLLARRVLSPEERALLEDFCRSAGIAPPRDKG
jgi:tRNA (guanine37-N1)-methyltransferase